MVKLSGILILLAFMLSCGKEIEDSSTSASPGDRTPSDPTRNPLPNISLEEFIKKQRFRCADSINCPSNIAKIIVVDKSSYKTCTGTLISDDRILTAASCFPRNLQVPKINCNNKIFTIFPGNQFQAEEIVNCERIEYADVNLPKDPVLWSRDHAVFKLDKKVSRLPYILSTRGLDEAQPLVSWKVNKIDNFEAQLISDECRVLFDSYSNPFSNDGLSPMVTGTDCIFTSGGIGSPLFQKEEIVATYTAQMESSLELFLKQSGMLVDDIGKFFHFSNLACSEFLTSRFDLPVQCLEEKSANRRDILRTKMMRSKAIHHETMNSVKTEVEQMEDYFIWNIKFYGDFKTANYEGHFAKPRCIFKSKQWIKRYRNRRLGYSTIDTKARIFVETPQYIFKTKLDADLRAKSILVEDGIKTYEIQFNPYSAHVKKYTNMKITSELHGEISSVEYEDVTADCGDL